MNLPYIRCTYKNMNVGLSAGQFSCLSSVSASSPQKSRNACFFQWVGQTYYPLLSLSLPQFSALNPSMTTVWELAHLHTCFFFFLVFISSCPFFFHVCDDSGLFRFIFISCEIWLLGRVLAEDDFSIYPFPFLLLVCLLVVSLA